MHVLVLATDALGGFGGIAKYNRDLLSALGSHPSVNRVTAIPRAIPEKVETMPPKLTYLTEGASGKFEYVRAAWRAVRSEPEVDLILCGHVNLVPLASALRGACGARVGLIIHGIEAWKRPTSVLINSTIRDLDAYISVSRVTRDRFCAWSGVEPGRVFLLPNCVDVSRFGPGPRPATLQKHYGLVGKRAILTLARLDARERYKGLDEIMEVMPDLTRRCPSLVYVIAGDGTDKVRLVEKSLRLGLEGRVIFTGKISEDTKAPLLRLADAMVMPGRGEGFGIVYLEAMACGIPVVASTLDGSREAVRDGTLGIMVNPDNRKELVDGILSALERPRGVVPRGLDYFSVENYRLRCHALIDQFLPEPAPPILKAA